MRLRADLRIMILRRWRGLWPWLRLAAPACLGLPAISPRFAPISPLLLDRPQQPARLRARARGNAHEAIAAKLRRAVAQQNAPARQAAHQAAGARAKIGEHEIRAAGKHARAQPLEAARELAAAGAHLANVAAKKTPVAERRLRRDQGQRSSPDKA